MTHILIVDPIAKSAITRFRQLGATVVYAPEFGPEQLLETMGEADILIVRSTPVEEAVIAASATLALIVRAGAGINTIDVNAATHRGIFVANAPGKNASAVAELVIGLLIALDRHIVDATTDLRNGLWSKKSYANGMGLTGNTMGILGFGATGQALARAARGLGMRVIAWSPSLTPKQASRHDIGFCARPAELARSADIVSIHLAANASTYHFVDQRFLQHMRDDAYLINTSRGELVDTQALKEAIRRKGLRVALDVFEREHAGAETFFSDQDLANMIVATPHLGGSTRQAMEAVSNEVIRVVTSFIETGMPLNAVNAPGHRNAFRAKESYDFA